MAVYMPLGINESAGFEEWDALYAQRGVLAPPPSKASREVWAVKLRRIE